MGDKIYQFILSPLSLFSPKIPPELAAIAGFPKSQTAGFNFTRQDATRWYQLFYKTMQISETGRYTLNRTLL